MAITIAANLSKKVPIPGTEYSSHQASITVTSEVTDLSNVIAESQRLFALAEAAVDQQLNLAAPPARSSNAAADAPTQTFANAKTAGHHPAGSASRPFPRSGAQRAPAPVTDSQLRFLERLITQTGTSTDAICSAYRIGSLADLSCKEAAGVIDELKSRTAA